MLSSRQAECIKLMIENPQFKGKELAAVLNVTPKTISQWKTKNPEFQEAFNSSIRSDIQYAASKALSKQIKLMDSKNDMVAHLAAKDIMDRAGFKPVDKVEQEVDMDLKITIDYGEDDA